MKTYQIYLVLLGYLLEQDGDTEELRTLLSELCKRAEERKEKIKDLEKEVTRLQLKVVELTNGIKVESAETVTNEEEAEEYKIGEDILTPFVKFSRMMFEQGSKENPDYFKKYEKERSNKDVGSN